MAAARAYALPGPAGTASACRPPSPRNHCDRRATADGRRDPRAVRDIHPLSRPGDTANRSEAPKAPSCTRGMWWSPGSSQRWHVEQLREQRHGARQRMAHGDRVAARRKCRRRACRSRRSGPRWWRRARSSRNARQSSPSRRLDGGRLLADQPPAGGLELRVACSSNFSPNKAVLRPRHSALPRIAAEGAHQAITHRVRRRLRASTGSPARETPGAAGADCMACSSISASSRSRQRARNSARESS